MEFKINIGEPKTGKTHKKDIIGDEANEFSGKKIGDKIKGDKIGFPGYEFEITGGSDYAGFPMRKDVEGQQRKKILITEGVGTRHKRKGIRLRRTVAGNTIFSKIIQINLKVIKAGKDPLGEVPAEEAPKQETAPAEDKKEEKAKEEKKEEKKEAPKEEVKEEKTEKKEEKPAEEKK